MLKARILPRDDAARTFIYAIDIHLLPAKKGVGNIRIDDIGNGRSHVAWSSNPALDPKSSAVRIAAMISGIYQAGLVSLETYHAT